MSGYVHAAQPPPHAAQAASDWLSWCEWCCCLGCCFWGLGCGPCLSKAVTAVKNVVAPNSKPELPPFGRSDEMVVVMVSPSVPDSLWALLCYSPHSGTLFSLL
jgi:hypothetical protein